MIEALAVISSTYCLFFFSLYYINLLLLLSAFEHLYKERSFLFGENKSN